MRKSKGEEIGGAWQEERNNLMEEIGIQEERICIEINGRGKERDEVWEKIEREKKEIERKERWEKIVESRYNKWYEWKKGEGLSTCLKKVWG